MKKNEGKLEGKYRYTKMTDVSDIPELVNFIKKNPLNVKVNNIHFMQCT